MPESEFWITITNVDEFVIEMLVEFETSRGDVTKFTVQLSVRRSGATEKSRQTIRRYDCAHGYAHMDVYNQAGEQVRKMPLDVATYNEALNQAYTDLKENAERYLRDFWRS